MASNTSTNQNTNTDRIPPPPPLPIHTTGYGGGGGSDFAAAADDASSSLPSLNAAPFPWILRVRCPKSPNVSLSWNNLATIRINIVPEMTPQVLGRCIGQAVASYMSSTSPNNVEPEHVAGLFGMHDGIFYSLEYILGDADDIESKNLVYSTVRPPPPPPPPPKTWTVWEYIALIVTVVAIVVRYGEYTLNVAVNGAVEVYYAVFDFPFRELYRYGPRFFGGWEGTDLPEICSRITYYGDRNFWMRNMSECESIFQSKEEAFIRVVRPGIYILIFLMLFWAAQHLVSSYAEQKRDRTDRAVLDTYHAVQTLIRLSNRSQGRR